MGTNANTQIWLGVEVENWQDIKELLIGFAEESYDRLLDGEDVEVEGLKFRVFKQAEEPVGFGILLLDRSWRDGPVGINPAAFAKSIEEKVPQVKRAFVARGIMAEPQVWLATTLS